MRFGRRLGVRSPSLDYNRPLHGCCFESAISRETSAGHETLGSKIQQAIAEFLRENFCYIAYPLRKRAIASSRSIQ